MPFKDLDIPVSRKTSSVS